MNRREALTSIYLENPCQVLPNALWKTLALLDGSDVTLEMTGSAVSHFEMWRGNDLFLYWDRERRPPEIPVHRQKQIEFALLHSDFLEALALDRFKTHEAYFRIVHRGSPTAQPSLPPGYRIARVDTATEADMVADMIGRCYDAIHPDEDAVRTWTQHPVFDPDLWLWVIDEKEAKPVALGIAEIDRAIPEGSLEWIQVLPTHQGRGLGKAIVDELLARLQGRVAFTTVSGAVDNQTHPEALYRRCGFTGNDVWHMLAR